MKSFKIFNLLIEYHFGWTSYRLKRLTFDLPDRADDVGICDHTSKKPWSYTIRYYIGCTPSNIRLPACVKVKTVSLTPRTEIIDGKKVYTSNRSITIDIYQYT